MTQIYLTYHCNMSIKFWKAYDVDEYCYYHLAEAYIHLGHHSYDTVMPYQFSYCNEHVTIYVISSDFGDCMTTQSMGLMVLLSEHF